MPPHPLCFLESRVPAERSPWSDGSPVIDEGDNSASWDPSNSQYTHSQGIDAIPLDMRGITSHPHPYKPSKPPTLKQTQLWHQNKINKLHVASHLREAGMIDLAEKLEHCHSYFTVCSCNECSTVRRFPNRCDLFCCPECAPHLQHVAQQQVEWWATRVTQPKHVVLTVKNIHDLRPQHVDELRTMFTRLRRRKFARNWRGGFYRIQCTNDGKGWHLHIHALVDAKWIDGQQLKEQWLSVTNGYGYICHVSDARPDQYLRVVTRYVVSGNQIASWWPNETAQFVRAFTAKRTFGVFGTLYGARTQFSDWLQSLALTRPRCDCGSNDVRYWSEAEWHAHITRAPHEYAPRPPPPVEPEFQFA